MATTTSSALSSPNDASTSLTLAQAMTPSRFACNASKPSQKSMKSIKSNKRSDKDGDCDEYKSPAPKSASEKREWERIATKMEHFHAHHRQAFENVWLLSERITDPYSIRPSELNSFLDYAQDFVRHLEAHHGIEEAYYFPLWAKRMPEFRDDHQAEHDKIHDGLDRYAQYIRAARSTPSAFRPEKLREIMASFGPILFDHLDAEVRSLGGDNMRKYYTFEEMRNMQF